MKSPFPGMDPYLERHWRDVHATLIVYMRDTLQPMLGRELRARVEERLVVETPFDGERSIYPDLRVFQSKLHTAQSPAAAGVATVEPLVIPCPDEQRTETFIEIIDPSTGRLVTAIEFLSPSNRLGGDSQRQYGRKLREFYEAAVNVVEIDLTRGGQRAFLLPQAQIPESYRTAFQACVYRALGGRPQFELYRMPLREPLPPIKIPLRAQDRDAVVALQPLVDRAYENGAYDDTDYRQPCIPPLDSGDAAWAEELLKATSRR